ncbi:MAG TPA: PepSY domain-containing protein [Gaiellaceae bacterium]|nr:PepSY domain-containing protein [Gaiellaceae bacterium]
MRSKRMLVIVLGAAAVLAVAGGAGIAKAVSGSEEQVSGPAAARAAEAALEAIGGGSVLEVERQDGDGAGVYEVEVRRQDGSTVEVHLDARLQPVGTVADDDEGERGDDAEGADD